MTDKYYCVIDNNNIIIDFGQNTIYKNIKQYDITKEEYDLLLDGKQYKLNEEGKIELSLDKQKQDKIKLLELYINDMKNIGVEYNGKWFKCDDEAQNNLIQASMMIDYILPLKWFTRNGEAGYIIINDKETWNDFVQILSNKIMEIKNLYYNYKYQIEQATTEEEINSIIFE